jgi:hemin uptake protein HemP
MAQLMQHTATPNHSPSGKPTQAHSASVPGQAESPVPSASLLRGHKTVAIAHNGMLYTLQATKMGKLILTK